MFFHLLYLLFALQFRNHCYLPPISLDRSLQVLFGEDRKSMLGDCFSVLVILMICLYSMFLIFFKIQNKKFGVRKCWEFYLFLFLACQILHVFLPDILVHCTLIDYAFI
jgi:hypothetical protein